MFPLLPLQVSAFGSALPASLVSRTLGSIRLQPARAVTMQIRCLIILGPTATGKTRLGVALARIFGGEIVSCDSRQVYRRLDIGTGKDLNEYGQGPDHIPVHLIDTVEPHEEYHLFRYLADARRALADIAQRGALPIIVGGSPLYLNALYRDYTMDGGQPSVELRRQLLNLSTAALVEILRQEAPDLFQRADLTQKRRVVRALEIARSRSGPASPPTAPSLDPLVLGCFFDRAEVRRRIEVRLDQRLAGGLIDEVRGLQQSGLSWERLDSFGLEYRCVALHLLGKLSYPEMRERLLARIRRFARSQDVWFRKMEREGMAIHWLPGADVVRAEDLVRTFLRGEPVPPPEFRLEDRVYGPRPRQRRSHSPP